MKHQTTFFLAAVMKFYNSSSPQENSNPKYTVYPKVNAAPQNKLNFFIISKRKKGRLDPATRFNVLRTKIKSLVRPKRFVAIVAPNTERASAKIIFRLQKHNARIGTIWFDSHGIYKKGRSLFLIGYDEINCNTIYDSVIASAFDKLVPFINNETNVVIGSCYAGATYQRPSVDYKDTTRMNGDSLMIAIGEIFPQAKVYASESWVMTKPGLFNDKKIAVTGYPKRKLFRDVCYRPVWENVGKWNMYDASENKFTSVNPVTLDSYGNLHVSRRTYLDKRDNRKDIAKNMKKLETDLFK